MRAIRNLSLPVVVCVVSFVLANCGGDDDPTPQPTDCRISVTSPATGVTLTEGQAHTIRWTKTNTCGANVEIALFKGSSTTRRCTIGSTTANDGSYLWTVDDCGGGTGSNYIIKIHDLGTDRWYASGNFGIRANDTQPPTVPQNLQCSVASQTQINLSWSASTDNVGVTGYRIYRDGSFLKQVTGTSTSDAGLSCGTQYCYRVSAVDAAGNESNQSSERCCTTNQCMETVYLELSFTASGLTFESNYWGNIWVRIHDSDPACPSWSQCGCGLEMKSGGSIGDESWFYPSETGTPGADWGLTTPCSCTSVDIRVTADMEDPNYNRAYIRTDVSGCDFIVYYYPNFTYSCDTRTESMDDACLKVNDRTEISIVQEDLMSGDDRHMLVDVVKYTFNGWLVPAGASYKGPAVILRSDDQPE